MDLQLGYKKIGYPEATVRVDEGKTIVTIGEKEYTLNTNGELGGEPTPSGVEVGEIFDQNNNPNDSNYDESKMHIGDFVNYSAGDWTEEDIAKITASGAKIAPNGSGTTKPSTNFQFGGFATDGSKDGNAVPYSNSYPYVTDAGTGNAVTGWRVFDVTDEGVVTLISAGCPEDYYHSGTANYAYISEYILTGNINARTPDTIKAKFKAEDVSQADNTYIPRDWSMYVGGKAQSATAITKAKLDAWYTRYTDADAKANTYKNATFQKIYGTKYESLIDIYAYYWLSSAGANPYVYKV